MPSDRFNDLLTNDSKQIRSVTSWNADGIITQHMEGFDDCVTKMSRWIINTREAGVRKALIEMGWTPPPDNTLEEITQAIDDESGVPAYCLGPIKPHKTAPEVGL